MSKELIRLKNLVMEFDGERILDNINLYINDHEFLTLLGPSGCGKTTTLRIIGGFLTPTSGDVLFDGTRMNDVPAYKRQINTVFQRYALFPHLDVYDNIAFGLRIARLPKGEIDRRVTEMLEVVSLKGYETRKITSLGSSSGWPSPGPWSTGPRCCFWTSLWARWICVCVRTCRTSSNAFSRLWGLLLYT